MPSNQRPLTKPRHKASASGFRGVSFISASPTVLRAGNALTLFCTVFLSFSLLFTFRSPDDVAMAGRRLEGYVSGGRYGGSGASTTGAAGKRCNALRLPGWISLSSSNADVPTWETFDSFCPSSHFLSSLHHSLAAAKPDMSLQDANTLPGTLNFLSNRTILVVGDDEPTQTRLTNLCTRVLDGESARIDVGHPWGAALQKPQDDGVDKTLGMGSYCYVRSKDLLIHHFPHSGVTSKSSVESRIMSLLPSLFTSWTSTAYSLPSLPSPRRQRSPDVTIWSSYSNDLTAWSKEDQGPNGVGLHHASPLGGSVVTISSAQQAQRLNSWRRGNLQAMQALKTATMGGGPSKVMWATPGYGDSSDHVASLSSTQQLAAGVASLLEATHGDKYLQSSVPGYLRLPSIGSRGSWFAGEIPWRKVSEGLDAILAGQGAGQGAATAGTAIRLGGEAETIEAALWGETLLNALGEVVP